MYLTLSAGGSAESRDAMVVSAIDGQLRAQNAGAPCRKLADALAEYVREMLPGDGSVSASLSISTWPSP